MAAFLIYCMKLLLPDNIFSKIFLSELNITPDIITEFHPSAVISGKLFNQSDAIGLIPTLDILTAKDLFISAQIGFSFNALLSNSYLFFKEKQKSINEIFLCGDITSNEVILSRILLKEFYDVDVKTTLLSRMPEDFNRNILVVGNSNFEKELFNSGISFAEEIIELIKAPYINFVIAGNSESSLQKFNSGFLKMLAGGHAESFDKLFPNLPTSSLEYIKLNIQHLVFDFDEQDIEAIKLLLQLPFYHGIIKDLIDVKFV